MRASRRSDGGQAVMLLVAVMALVAASMMAMAHFGARVVAREQAQVAADAAALAGVTALDTGARAAASALAARNGGVLVSFRQLGDDVVVVVEVGGEQATARASRAP
jgi:secretion/DNA translocation related TadE-like protein